MTDAEAPPAPAPVPATISVEIVSPSAGVPVPLLFPDLSIKTTVAQLKDMVRQRLTVPDPTAVDLRVIYQGKMLAPPELTLENILGHDAIRESRKRVFHVVANTSARVPAVPYVAPDPNAPPPPPTPAAQLEAIRRHHIATRNQLLAANQRARAALNLNGIQDQPGPVMNHSTTTTTTTMRIMSPGGNPAQQGFAMPLPGAAATEAVLNNHFQALRSHFDALRTSQGAQTGPAQAMAGSGANSSTWQQGTAPQPQHQHQHQRQYQYQYQQQQQPSVNQTHIAGPQVYLLSSPSGPEAILVHNNGSAYVSSPSGLASGVDLGSARARATVNQPTGLGAPGQVAGQLPAETAHQLIERWRENGRRRHEAQLEAWRIYQQMRDTPRHQRPHNLARAQQARGARIPRAGGLLAGHHQNGQAAGALAAALWPHLWLMIRMGIFIYWFRFLHSESSWERWFIVLGLVFVVLVINTGMLNGLVDQAWQPVREHLDRLMPMGPGAGAQAGADAAAQGLPQQNNFNGDNGAPRAPAAEPDPAAAAARMVAARRDANANWLLDQVRRVERAGLLFLASIAPGVAERHIAHLEEEARAERRRQEAAAAAAAQAEAAAAEAAAAEAGTATETEASSGQASAETGAPVTVPIEGVSQAVDGASGGGDAVPRGD